MKRLIPAYALVCATIFLASCTQDQDIMETDSNLLADAILLKDELPNKSYDTSKKGLYHGVVAAANSTSRGKIWINLSNNANYYALIELVSGEEMAFKLKPQFMIKSTVPTIYEFTGDSGSFIFDVSDISNPQIHELVLNSQNYFSQVVKSMSYNMASSATAVFTETGNPAFTGTWSLLADGTISSPNGNGGDGITSVMVVYLGEFFEDFDFDSYNASVCLGNGSYVPTLNSFGTPGFTISDYQTTAFANGMAKWNLSYDPNTSSYMNYLLCQPESAGTFSWSSIDGTIVKYGEIILD